MKKVGLVLVLVMALGLGFGIGARGHVQAGTGYAQLSLQNSTPFTLDLYVDGSAYGCRALGGGFCTTHVTAGFHTFTAKTSDGSMETSDSYNFQEGDSITWTVVYEPPQQ